MTREEALYKAKHLRKVHPSICIDAEDFWDTVIAALVQEPCDAVSRKEVMNMLHNHAFDYATSTKILSLLKTMRGEVDRMPSVTPVEKVVSSSENPNKWIPVSERLPKAGEYIGDVARYYLVQNEFGDMMVARYRHSEYWQQIHQLKPIGDEIVAWMPLPEPYKASPTGAESEDKE